jgi:hypothetical protein
MSPTPIGPRHQTSLPLATAISVAQLGVLVIGVATVFVTLGRRDAVVDRLHSDMGELRAIAQELVKSQVLGAANDKSHEDALRAVSARLDRMESRP